MQGISPVVFYGMPTILGKICSALALCQFTNQRDRLTVLNSVEVQAWSDSVSRQVGAVPLRDILPVIVYWQRTAHYELIVNRI